MQNSKNSSKNPNDIKMWIIRIHVAVGVQRAQYFRANAKARHFSTTYTTGAPRRTILLDLHIRIFMSQRFSGALGENWTLILGGGKCRPFGLSVVSGF